MAPPTYKKLIAGHDGTDRAADGLALAELLANVTGAELVAVTVVPAEVPYAPGTFEYEEQLRSQAADALAVAVPEGGHVQSRVLSARTAAQGLHDLAESENADALVLGSCRRGPVGRVLAGSVAERLLHGAPCPIAVAPAGYRERPEGGLRVVACAFDGSDEAGLALQHAEEIARRAGAVLRLLTVHEPEVVFGVDQVPGGYDRTELGRLERERITRELEKTVEAIGPGIDVQHQILEGMAVKALAEAAADGVDLMVVGSRGYGPVRRVLLGGVSSGLVRCSPAPVLAVPRGEG